jgi:nucleolar GTP-binding protein
MNFQELRVVETPAAYLDTAFRRSRKKLDNFKPKGKDRFPRQKEIELVKLESFHQTLCNSLMEILKSFPLIEELDRFYLELIKVTLDYTKLKKSLGAVNWAEKKVSSFSNIYRKKLQGSRDSITFNKLKLEYYGRTTSFVKQIKDELAYLEHARRIMKDYPAIKTKIPTVCIFGFPNAGKSTLLSKLTSAKPDINSYPFTTRRINIGYLEHNYRKIQLIDTPGSLNRFNKMNDIEKQAYLALKYLADQVIFVIDPTEEYSMDKQEKLLDVVRESDKPVLLYISKSDSFDATKIKERFPQAMTDIEELRKKLLSTLLQS